MCLLRSLSDNPCTADSVFGESEAEDEGECVVEEVVAAGACTCAACVRLETASADAAHCCTKMSLR